MLNFVTGPEGYPAAVLVRSVSVATGPGRLTVALGIDAQLNAKPMGEDVGLWLLPPESASRRPRVRATPRIGIDYAGPVWTKRKLRYVSSAIPDLARSARQNR